MKVGKLLKNICMKLKKHMVAGLVLFAGVLCFPFAGFAAGEVPTTVQNATELILNIVAGVGVCFIAFGVITLAISFQSHDDSQRSRAVMSIIGGAIAVSVRAVLSALGVGY